MSLKIKFYEKFPIYVAKWLTPEICVIAGGGGDGIPNFIKIYRLKGSDVECISEYNTKKEVCLTLDVNMENRYILFTSLTHAHLLTFSKRWEINPVRSILLPSIMDVRKIKCSVHDDRVAISDDTPRVALYDLKKLTILKKIATKTSVVDVKLTKTVLLIVEPKRLAVYQAKNNKFMFQHVLSDINTTFRMARVKNSKIYLLKSGKMGPTHLIVFDLSGNIIHQKQIHSKAANTMEMSALGDLDCIIVTIGEGIAIYDTNLNFLSSQGNLHGFATSSCDVYARNGELTSLSGGLDNSISLIRTKPQKSYFYWILGIIVAFLAFLLFWFLK